MCKYALFSSRFKKSVQYSMTTGNVEYLLAVGCTLWNFTLLCSGSSQGRGRDAVSLSDSLVAAAAEKHLRFTVSNLIKM